jgi:hypothetical protein
VRHDDVGISFLRVCWQSARDVGSRGLNAKAFSNYMLGKHSEHHL